MFTSNRFSLTLESLAKLVANEGAVHSTPQPALPSLSEVLAEFAPLPRAALFLGLATDGLPILLNLLDPLPGPIMITGDEGCGKTKFLLTISNVIDHVQSSSRINYLVITDNIAEWKDAEHSRNCEEVLSTQESKATSYLHSLVEWAHSNTGEGQIYLLLIDHLESLIAIPETQQDLRWLLLRGPSRRIWPLVTINSAIAVSESCQPWLNAFRTRLFGCIHDDHHTELLTAASDISFANLTAGIQFAMREGNHWLQFWLPSRE
jgi:energy-coupling factor transporter ATP-binding protein EcfA2